MKHFILLAALLCAALTSPCLLVAQNLKAEMQAIVDEYTAIQKRGDAVAKAVLYADTIVYINVTEGTTIVRTNAETQARNVKYFSEYTEMPSITLGAVEMLPDGRARMSGQFTGIITKKATGAQKNYSATFEHTLIKKDGRWKFCQIRTAQTMESIEEDLRAFAKQYQDAFNKEDYATLQTYWTNDAVRVAKNGSTTTGAEAIGALLAKQFENENATLTSTVTLISWSDAEYAYVLKSTFQLTGVNTKGEKIDIAGTGTRIMRKESGVWRIAKLVLTD
jgi:ketosteroid isomerase-like protein